MFYKWSGLFAFSVCLMLAMHFCCFAATPLHITLSSNLSGVSPCQNGYNERTYGLDIGLLSSRRCVVGGIQLSPMAGASRLYGLQIAPIAAGVSEGYGISIAGVVMQSSHKFSGILFGGLLTNLTFEGGAPDVNGLQISGLANMAGEFNGVQISFVNYAGTAHGLQFGGLNIQESDRKGCPLFQLGIYNKSDSSGGAQIGVVNTASGKFIGGQLGVYNNGPHLSGMQLGIVNKTDSLYGLQLGLVNIISPKYRKIDVPFFPLINAAF